MANLIVFLFISFLWIYFSLCGLLSSICFSFESQTEASIWTRSAHLTVPNGHWFCPGRCPGIQSDPSGWRCAVGPGKLALKCLPRDVLDLILQICSISSLAIISCVSFHVRELALPHLLRRVYLDRNPQQILTFLNFILDNAHDSDLGIISAPGRHVLELELDILALRTHVFNDDKGRYEVVENEEYPISTWAPVLTKALRLMPNLRSFALHGHGQEETEEIVTYSPDFVPTVLSLPQLASFILRGIGFNTSLSFGKAIDMLKGDTKLQALDLLVAGEDEEEMEVVVHEGLGRFLSHYSVHLTDLYLNGLDLRPFLREDEHRPDNSRVTFPSVGKLRIGSCALSLKGLATAFPALHTLHLGFCDFLGPYSTGPRQNHVSFPNLISIKGHPDDIYAILNSSACRDHMRRAVMSVDWNDDIYAVPKAAPHLKSLHFSQSNVKPPAWWKALGETLPELTYLDIALSVDDGLHSICNHIPSAIARIPLEYITLLVQGYPLIDDPVMKTTVPEEAIALSYAQGIPTLKYIDVSKNDRTLPSSLPAPVTWWKVVREVVSNGKMSVQVKSMDADEGRVLREWYDLQAYGGIVVPTGHPVEVLRGGVGY